MGDDIAKTLIEGNMNRSVTEADSKSVRTIDSKLGRSPRPSTHNVGYSLISIASGSASEPLFSQHQKKAPSFMDKRDRYRIIIDEDDCTPDNITDPDYITMEDNFSHAAYESKVLRKSEMVLRSVTSQKSAMTGMKVFATTIDLDDVYIDHTVDTDEGYAPDEIDLDRAPSAYGLPKILPIMSYPPEIFITLRETDTHYLFSLPGYSYDKGTPEATIAEEENNFYEYITVGKGRNRKMVNQETQSRPVVCQTRHSLATRPRKKNASAFASVWDMHDTYQQLSVKVEKEEEDEMVMYQSAAAHLLRKKRVKAKLSDKKKGKNFKEISATPEYNDAVVIIQRVLASHKYSDAQKKFRGLIRMDPLAPDLVYIYTLQALWSFECEETTNRAISSLCFNPANANILAVGYGKFGYAEFQNGLVCIWSTKNPSAPERLYRFDDPVTSVSFSTQHPNWLACGFGNGDVLLLDITFYTKKIMAKSKRDTNPCFEPIWVTTWCKLEATEFVLTAGQDGRINKFTNTKTHEFICTPMMRISTVEGKMKGLESTKACPKFDVPITRYPAALCVKWHPTISHVYLVGTDEGCIHKCSTHYLNQHMDVFRAHAGPVYGMEYSPFMRTLLVSCGADSAIRLWIEEMDDVIMTLTCQSAVYGIAFCPINSTILLSVSGNILSVWDLRRKTHIPCAEYTFPSQVILTHVRFAASGNNVFVGDSIGKIYTFYLEDTPIPPYYQRKMLDEAIKRALCTRPHMLKQLQNLEKYRDKCAKS